MKSAVSLLALAGAATAADLPSIVAKVRRHHQPHTCYNTMLNIISL